jgi:hypothetical protein
LELSTAAKVALAIQNASVVACCVILCLFLTFGDGWEASYGPWTTTLSHAAVILTADVAALFSEAQKIILERDWIVIISGSDPDHLARELKMSYTYS